jgi:hypothetical protein
VLRVQGILVAVAVVLMAWGTRVSTQNSLVESRWRTSDIVVDGSADEWNGLTAALTGVEVSEGIANDGERLYVCLLARDPQTREQILRRGLIIWFDPAGGTRKTFGIKFPVGVLEVAEGRSGMRAGRSTAKKAPEPIEIVNRLEVLGPKKDDRRSLVLDMVPGISVTIGQPEGLLVYELSVPLERTTDHPYAVGAKPGSIIGIGLATPEQERAIVPAESPGRSGSGGRGGFGGIGGGTVGGGMGGRPPDANRDAIKPLKPMKTWLKVQLASPTSVLKPGL